jgi:tetratricopeptide (TPR) repeat protein
MLEDPQASASELTTQSDELLGHIDSLPKRAGEAQFLAGSAYLRLARVLPPDQAAAIWKKARAHLELAEQLGVQEVDAGPLLFRLGKAHYQTGGEAHRVIQYLSSATDISVEERADAYEMLSQTYLKLKDIRSALAVNEKLLQLPTRDENLLAPARLLRGELLLEQHEHAVARKLLARIGPGAPRDIQSRALFLQASSYQQEGAWAEAAELWNRILAQHREMLAERGRILYWLGLCYRNLKQLGDAAHTWEQAVALGGEEGMAAALQLANLRTENGKHAAGLELLARVLRPINRPEEYHNSLVDLAQAQKLLEAASRHALAGSEFEVAQKLAHVYARLAPPGPAHMLLGLVAEKWGEAQRQQAGAQAHYREAGEAYQAVAEATVPPAEQAQWLWQASACFSQAQDLAHVTAALERFLQLPSPAERLSEGWYRLGQAQQTLHNDIAAEKSYQRAIAEKSDSAFAYRARYQLAAIKIAHGHRQEAEEILQHNLAQMLIKPDPEAQEKSLFAYAEQLYSRGDYRMAAERWEQALTLYPGNADGAAARFRLGQSYRHLAEMEYHSLRPAERLPGEDVQRHYRRQFNYWLEKAAANFQKLIDDLQVRRGGGPLSEAEALILRRARFALADCRFDQGQYTEGVRLFDSLAQEYQKQVDGLIALKNLWSCYVVPRPADLDKAAATLKRARIFLEALDEAAFKDRPEAETRKGWQQWILQAEQQLPAAEADHK